MPPVQHLEKILDKLFKLKTFIKEALPETGVILSTPTIRSDNGKTALTVRNLCEHFNMGSRLKYGYSR